VDSLDKLTEEESEFFSNELAKNREYYRENWKETLRNNLYYRKTYFGNGKEL